MSELSLVARQHCVQSVKQEVEITSGKKVTKKALAEWQAMHARALTTLRRENQQSK